MKKGNKTKLLLELALSLAVVSQLARLSRSQDAAARSGKASETILDDVESGVFLEENSNLIEKTFGNNDVLRDLENSRPQFPAEWKYGIPLKDNDNMEDLDPLLTDHKQLFVPQDVNSGLRAASVHAVATDVPQSNSTLLDKMRTLMKSNVFSDLSMLDSLNWFDEDDHVFSPSSRVRRLAEPYRYRRFQQPLRAYVPEDSPVGTIVLEIPRNYEGSLEIVHPENPICRVNSQSGILETIVRLDYERQKVYTLIIRDALNDTEHALFYSHDVIIYVIDVNDNEPTFNMATFSGHVNSGSWVGAPVAQLNATDPDGGVRGRIGFTVDDRNSPFTVNPKTWGLETNGKPLDPSQSQYPVNVRAFDEGYPRKESPTVVIDVRKADESPRFSESAYTISYSEKTLPGVIIGRVMAKSLSNIPVGYEVVPTSDVYGINARGELSLKRSVDYETAGSSATTVITVKASELTNDNPLSSQILVTLVVTNDDEYPTTFTEALYQAQIDEDISRGSLVTNVTVRDCDCANNCHCSGSEIRFTLLNTDDYFVINEAGEIRTAKSFDYDIQNVFQFMVTAHDNLGNRGDQIPARAYVSVRLRDVNNHAPVFTQTLYHFNVDEDSDIGHHVGVVQATDRDTTASPLTYSIKDSVPRDGAFAITDQRFGILTVASSLNLKTQSSFTLTIEASDDLQSSETTVTIEVDDVNDNAPRFTTCPDSVNVEENVFVGAVVTVLEAKDSDRGRNALLEYYIERSHDLFTSDHNEVFVINNATGEVKTAHALDRETKRYYFLIASAKDRSHDSELRQVGYCQFVINVLDVNDNYPFFEVRHYETSVHQDTKVGSSVLKVQAIDDDIGVNAEMTYSIDGKNNDLFDVNSDGWVTTKSKLQGKLGKTSFTITAKNTRAYVGKAKPDDTQKTTVEIGITAQSLHAFTQLAFQTQVSEDTLVGKTVLNVSAVASSPDKSVIYFLAKLRHTIASEFPFRVDHATGSIQLASGLDFESRQKYVFSVNANEIGSLEPVEATIEIDVVDINDVAPIFGRSRYDGTVSEDAQPGAVVIRIRATDHDPQNVVITYEIEESKDSDLFELKKYQTSVEILTKQKFDREKTDNYNVILVAIDNGDPKLRSTAYVTVHVLDENDSPPVFDSAHYSVSVPENTPVGQTIETVITRDEDYGENARTLFLIASGNDGRFRMTSEQMEDSNRGYLVIAKPLDYETRSEYNLTVVGSDKKFSNTTIITVKITNSDDDPPYFQQSLYNTSLAENTAPGTLVLVVEAIDNDSPSAHLVYNIDTSAAMFFVIGSNTGALTTFGTPLDHERTPIMVLSVTVSDGTNKARTFVEITVSDVNEPPRFPNPPYIGDVNENQPVGTPVRYVTAFDDDNPETNDGKNSYSVVRNSGESTYDEDGQMFTIDPVSGLLRTAAMFNLEVIRRNLTIQVRATDGGSPSLPTVTEVTIVVQDVSEFPPKFASGGYSTNIAEDTLVGRTVLTLTVVDEDFTNVGHRYSITNGNYPFAFYIQPKTGEILVAGIIDYETTKEYNLTVSISERNMSKTFESDYASVFINILDANDQPPVFQPKSYHRRISEDVAPGTEVRVVSCSDRDMGANAVPTFSITSGNIDDLFEVKSDSNNKNLGVVQVSGHLDKEKISAHTLEITATDIGGLMDTATLVVEVEDVNDTPPKFNPAYYEGSILGSVRQEQRVLTISATDSDQAPNGGPLTFTLKNFEDKFQLKNPAAQTVDLYTNSIEFTRETTPLYQVLVEANDTGSPKLSAEAMIFVSVVDVEANQEPFDGSLTIIVFTQNGYFPGGTIGTVYYKDDDYKEDQNQYTIVSQGPGTYFTVDSTTGLIRCAVNISDGVYSLNVTVRQTSSTVGKVVSSKITVRVRSVNETAVHHSVALRFPLRTPALFVNSLYLKLVETLAEIFLVSSDHVYVFSIGQSSGGVADSPYGVDVWIVIRSTGDEYMNPNYVFTQLEMNYNKLTALGVGQLEIGYDECAAESKTVGVCKNILRTQKSFTVVSGYYGQVPAPNFSQTLVGIDTELRAIYEVLPEPPPDCSTMPCKNGGTCHDVVPQGFVCQCPPGFRGPECQVTTRTFNKPDSYIWLEPLAAYELSSFSFEFMSETNIGNGLLLYQGPIRPGGNNGLNDFLAVSLLSGYITVAVSLGGRPSSFNSRTGERLDDGRWHHVEIKRAKKEIRLIIDHCETAVTTEKQGRFFEDRTSCEMVSHSFENFIYLNGLGPLQIGGSSLSSFPVSPITTRSFYGCIRNIYDNHRMYDLRYPLRVVNSAVGCRHGCHSNPCQNGGYCEGEMYSGSSCCTCVPGFTGCDCSEHSPSFWYLRNSFTKYNMNFPILQGRKRRQIFPSFPRFFKMFFTQLVFRLRVHLGTSDAIFFRSSSREDSFSELGMENKVLYYTFKFADEMKTISLPGGSIDDDKWHNIHVRRQGNTASLQLDYKAKSYGTTGGIVRLVDYSGGSMYTGGIPRFVSEGSQLGSNGSLGVFDGKTNVSNVVGDFQGCTSATVYNGRELGRDSKFTQFRVVKGCPCTAVVDCRNNGTCVDEDPPYCLCPKGFTGRMCNETIVVPTVRTAAPIAGFRSSSRNRFLDPVWLCVFLMSLITLIFLLCLLHTLAVVGDDRPLIEEDAHDSIMAYQGHGIEETDATGYDITILMKHSRRQVASSSYTATEGKFEEAGNQGMDAVDARGGAVGARDGVEAGEGGVGAGGAVEARGGAVGARDGVEAGEGDVGAGGGAVDVRGDDGRLESWIMERVSIADRDFSSFPQDEMWEIRDEGKFLFIRVLDDLSELEHDSDEEREDGIDVFAIDWDNFVR